MKSWIAVLIPVIISKLNSMFQPMGQTISENVINKIIDKALQNSRRIIILVINAIIATSFLIAGVIIGGLNISKQIEQSGSFNFSAGVWFSIVLIIISIVGLIIAFDQKRWTALREDGNSAGALNESINMNSANQNLSAKNSPIEVAVSSLIQDFIAQRQEERQRKYAEFSAAQEKQKHSSKKD